MDRYIVRLHDTPTILSKCHVTLTDYALGYRYIYRDRHLNTINLPAGERVVLDDHPYANKSSIHSGELDSLADCFQFVEQQFPDDKQYLFWNLVVEFVL